MKSQCLHLAFPSSSVFLMHTGYTVQETLCTVHVLFTHCSWDPQPLYSKNIKNRSHGTIYTFKNYFATVFSVSVFSFQQNKRYLNEPYIYNYSLVGRKYSSGFPHISKPAATTYNFGFQWNQNQSLPRSILVKSYIYVPQVFFLNLYLLHLYFKVGACMPLSQLLLLMKNMWMNLPIWCFWWHYLK